MRLGRFLLLGFAPLVRRKIIIIVEFMLRKEKEDAR